MMQIMSFLTRYADELSVLLCGLAIALLLVTLHRMRRIIKLIQGITGNISDENRNESARENTDDRHTLDAVRTEAENGLTEEECAALLSDREGGTREMENTQPEDLLSAVLDEVFP